MSGTASQIQDTLIGVVSSEQKRAENLSWLCAWVPFVSLFISTSECFYVQHVAACRGKRPGVLQRSACSKHFLLCCWLLVVVGHDTSS